MVVVVVVVVVAAAAAAVVVVVMVAVRDGKLAFGTHTFSTFYAIRRHACVLRMFGKTGGRKTAVVLRAIGTYSRGPMKTNPLFTRMPVLRSHTPGRRPQTPVRTGAVFVASGYVTISLVSHFRNSRQNFFQEEIALPFCRSLTRNR
jgi:hypothetical protein